MRSLFRRVFKFAKLLPKFHQTFSNFLTSRYRNLAILEEGLVDVLAKSERL